MKRSSRPRTTKPKPAGNEPNSNPSGHQLAHPSGHQLAHQSGHQSECEPTPGEATLKWHPERIISGGQTGVDRAALDAAIELGIPHGGWCPRGRRAENGVIPSRYQLKEIEGIDYSERTRRNIVESDATLILTSGPLQGGTLLTFNLCIKLSRPVRVVQLPLQPGPPQLPVHKPTVHAGTNSDHLDSTHPNSSGQSNSGSLPEWLAQERVRILNVAGPRASKSPKIYQLSKAYLLANLGTGLLANLGTGLLANLGTREASPGS